MVIKTGFPGIPTIIKESDKGGEGSACYIFLFTGWALIWGGGGVLDERLGACLRKFLLKYNRIKDHDWQEENQS